MNIDKKLMHTEFLNREYNISHMAYEREMAFFQSIREGDWEKVRSLFKPLANGEMGKLSAGSGRVFLKGLMMAFCCLRKFQKWI